MPNPDNLAAAEEKTSQGRAFDHQVGGTHYKAMRIQPAVFSEVNGLSHLEGEAIKRISTWRGQGDIEELRKARHEIEMLIDLAVSGRLEGGKPD